jgi:hypothetical protein
MGNRIKRGVVRADLPETPEYGVMLYCHKCGGEWSASHGDYFWQPEGKPIQCRGDFGGARHRPINMILARKRTLIETVLS